MELTVSGDARRTLALPLGSASFYAVCEGFGAIDRRQTATVALEQLKSALAARLRSGRMVQALARPKSVMSLLVSALGAVNAHLYRRSASHEDYVTAGASLTAAIVLGDRVYLAHVGSTAAYLARGGYAVALTKDDCFAFDVPTGRAIAVSAHPPVLTRALGAAPSVEVTVCNFRIASGDAIVLASKRLSDERRTLAGWTQRPDRTVLVANIEDTSAQVVQKRGASMRVIAAGFAMFLACMLLA